MKSTKSRRRPTKKKNQNNVIPMLFFVIIVAVVANIMVNNYIDKITAVEDDTVLTDTVPTSSPTATTEPTVEPTEEPTPEPTEDPVVTLSEDEQWKLILVNDSNFLDEDFCPDEIVTIDGYNIDARIEDELQQMLDDAEADGVTIILTSAFRSYTTQATLFTNRITRMMNAGMTYEEALADTELVIQEAGSSEHQTGLAVDVYTNDSSAILNEAFGDTEAYEWLMANSYKYGFVERYPVDKVDITHITWESWHFRYVGVEVATYMVENDLCLEEYIDLIS